MLSEKQTEWIINNNLVNKGWCIDGDDKRKNVFFQRPKLESQREKLNGKRPDFILYASGTDKPIAIIEAKKSGSNLEPALKQGIDYALALEAPIVLAMNGTYCETYFVPNGKSLILNGNEVRELLREAEALKFLRENSNEDQVKALTVGIAQPQFNVAVLKKVMIHLLPLEVQQEIILRNEKERRRVLLQEDIIKYFEARMENKLNCIWSDQMPAIVERLEIERKYIESQQEIIRLFERKMQDSLNSLWSRPENIDKEEIYN